MKIKYQTLETRLRKKSNSGTRIVPKYVRKINDNGQPKMVAKEKFNLYADIQTYKNDNNILKILEKYGGDISKLDFNKGEYLDLRKVPDSYNDIMNQRTDIFNDYEKLPTNFKNMIENNFDIYYGLVMNGKIKDVIEKYQNKSLNINDLKDATKIEPKKEDKNNEVREPAKNE